MKKYTLYVLIALMSVSLIGIIWVQVYWIHNGVKVKEAQFDQLVIESLNHVITEIEEDESINFLHDQLASSTSKIIIETDSANHHKVVKEHWVGREDEGDPEGHNNGFSFDFTNDNGDEDFEMKISVNGETKTIDIKNKLEMVEQILESDSLGFIGEEDVVFSNRFENIMIKMVKEFKEIDEPVFHLLQNSDIDSVIQASLTDNGINLPFSYAVLQNDSILTEFSSSNFDATNNIYKVDLFKHQLIDKSAKLGVSFGNKRHYVLKSIWLMLCCSVLFTLIILITFSSTLYYMFKQKKLSEIKNDFINNMTHEFKTPISTISLAIDSITHPKIIGDKDQINYFADIVRQENKRMNKQVESVLNTSLAEKNELTLDKKEIKVDDLVHHLKERMGLQIDAAKAVFNVTVSGSTPSVFADRIHLQNAICNLIDNAIKYAKSTPQITLNIYPQENMVSFEVSDNGVGMNKETQKKVFDKFYRVQSGNIHDVKGFGIGLSYVKAIIDAHGGKIELTSRLNHGTSIILKIPIKDAK